MSLFRYRRNNYLHGDDNPHRWANYRSFDKLRQLKIDDYECFMHHMPTVLMGVFSDSYGEKPRFVDKEEADTVFGEFGVDPDIMCERRSYSETVLASGSILWFAVQRLNTPQTEYCLSIGADPKLPSHLDGSLPIHQAVIHGAEILCPKNEDNDTYRTKNRVKTWKRYLAILDVLQAAGVDINQTDLRGWTALMHLSSCMVLTKDAASDYCRSHDDRRTETRFPDQEKVRRLDALCDLLRRGARVDVLSSAGESAVSLAAKCGDYHMLRIMCEAQPDAVRRVVDVKAMDGHCPVHRAALSRSVPILNKVLEHGADGYAMDVFGQTAANIVLRNASKGGSRFSHAEDQRLLTVLPHHGFAFDGQLSLFRDAVHSNDLMLISVVLEGGFVIDVHDHSHQRIYLECATKSYDEMFQLLEMLAAWPRDVQCDAWLLRVAMSEGAFGTSEHDQQKRDTAKAHWDRAVECGVETHAFPLRMPPGGDEEQTRERLTIFNNVCTECRTWAELRRSLGHQHESDEPLVISEQSKIIHKLYFHRLACLHRIFGFHHTLVIQQYHVISRMMLSPRKQDEARKLTRVDDRSRRPGAEVRRLELEFLERECARMTCLELEIGLEINFTLEDTEYLRQAVSSYFADAKAYEDQRSRNLTTFSVDETDLPLLARWSFHVLKCTPPGHFLQERVMEAMRGLLQHMASYCQVDEAHMEHASTPLAAFSTHLGGQQRGSVYRMHIIGYHGYSHAVHSDLRMLCCGLAAAWKHSRHTHFSTIVHQLMVIPKREDRPQKKMEKEELRERLPILEALVLGGFDLHACDADGVSAMAFLLNLHTELIDGDVPDSDEVFAMWNALIGVLQTHGAGVHWDAPHSYGQSLMQRARAQFADLECLGPLDAAPVSPVPRLLCLAARVVTTLPMTARQFLPARMLQVVDLHRPPATPAGRPMRKLTEKVEFQRDDVDRELPVRVEGGFY